MSATTTRKILIDTDPGIDDAMAIFYALASPELDVVGLTTVFGNAHTSVCTTERAEAVGDRRPHRHPRCQGRRSPAGHALPRPGGVRPRRRWARRSELAATHDSPLAIDAAHFIIRRCDGRRPGRDHPGCPRAADQRRDRVADRAEPRVSPGRDRADGRQRVPSAATPRRLPRPTSSTTPRRPTSSSVPIARS